MGTSIFAEILGGDGDKDKGLVHHCERQERQINVAGNHGVVAEDEIVAGARMDRIATRAADDEVVVRAGKNEVRATVGKGNRLGQGQGATDPNDMRMIAEDHVVAVAGIDPIRASATGHEIVSRTGRDNVVTTKLRRARDQRGKSAVNKGDGGMVTHDHIVAFANGDGVTSGAAHDHVVACTGSNHISAACLWTQDFNLHQHMARHREQRVVAHDDVVAFAAVDHVVAIAAEDEVVAFSAVEHIAGATGVGIRGKGLNDPGAQDHDAFVANDDIIVQATPNRVRALAAQDDVLASFTMKFVIARVRGDEAFNGNQFAADEQHFTAVTENDVHAAATANRVVVGTAKHDVHAGASRDVIRAARAGIVQGRRVIDDTIGHMDESIVTKDQVVAFSGIDRVGARTA